MRSSSRKRLAGKCILGSFWHSSDTCHQERSDSRCIGSIDSQSHAHRYIRFPHRPFSCGNIDTQSRYAGEARLGSIGEGCQVQLEGTRKRRQRGYGSSGDHLAVGDQAAVVDSKNGRSRDPEGKALAHRQGGGHRSNHLAGPVGEEDRPMNGGQTAAAEAGDTAAVAGQAEAAARQEADNR